MKNVGPIRHCKPPHAACFTLSFTRCRYYRTPPAHRCPHQHRQQRQRVTEGTAMAPWNGPNYGALYSVCVTNGIDIPQAVCGSCRMRASFRKSGESRRIPTGRDIVKMQATTVNCFGAALSCVHVGSDASGRWPSLSELLACRIRHADSPKRRRYDDDDDVAAVANARRRAPSASRRVGVAVVGVRRRSSHRRTSSTVPACHGQLPPLDQRANTI